MLAIFILILLFLRPIKFECTVAAIMKNGLLLFPRKSYYYLYTLFRTHTIASVHTAAPNEISVLSGFVKILFHVVCGVVNPKSHFSNLISTCDFSMDEHVRAIRIWSSRSSHTHPGAAETIRATIQNCR